VVTPNIVRSALFFAAGLVLSFGIHAGLYATVAPILTAFIGGITSAWVFMTRVQE
jgi:hypothetical protein